MKECLGVVKKGGSLSGSGMIEGMRLQGVGGVNMIFIILGLESMGEQIPSGILHLLPDQHIKPNLTHIGLANDSLLTVI